MEGKGERVVTTDGKRYWSLALLFAAGVLNLFDRQIVNILGQDIKTELGLSDVQLGLLAGTAFGIFYGILGIPLGRLADRVDRVKLIAGVLVIWSGFTVLCGFAGSFLQLFVTRMGVGVGEAGSQPASTALIPDMFAAERRTSALALLLVSAPVGSFLGLLVGGFVGATWGWRTAFVMSGMPGFALAIVMVTTMRDPRAAVVRGMARPPNGNSVRWTEALRSLIRTPRVCAARPGDGLRDIPGLCLRGVAAAVFYSRLRNEYGANWLARRYRCRRGRRSRRAVWWNSL